MTRRPTELEEAEKRMEQTRADLREVFKEYRRCLQLTQNKAGAASASTARTTEGTSVVIDGTSAVIDGMMSVIQRLAHNR